ncbi:NAD(P)H-dependent oxidoreductase [Motilimonas sp. 1_MG-2023]|uniref:NADPH-dependent FMN reductase n=1 Tax=Motilimonas TaxID=1914248 RepID=UPI001E2C350E|nr:NAD(P)H-dependent oxidoreductase [Motilimonas sp. 1_MG-2023]MCE0558744.1 NAD(P)H-dependent oxidoreductase [Motilimonas sp. E26]MDO6525406.1 NAD(P)H-dependent oxidoreductase [Motilimonas sp. 1_MG-2023]
MNIVIISGSQRKNSSAFGVAQAVATRAKLSDDVVDCQVLSLAKLSIPLWDEDLCKELDHWMDDWFDTHQLLAAADAVVIVSPEWEEVTLKNFFALCERSELSTLPGVVVRIASTCRGAFSAQELRLSNFVFNRLCYVLDHIVVATTDEVVKCKHQDYFLDGLSAERVDYGFKLMSCLVEGNSPISHFMRPSDMLQIPMKTVAMSH